MSVRIIAGKFRGWTLDVPQSARPTLIRNRKSLFDIIEAFSSDNIGHFFNKKIVLDCFAGSGALGIEAVSRGASHAYLVDASKQACTVLKKNTRQAANLFSIICSDIFQLRNRHNVRADIVFIDPPYGQISIDKIITYLRKSNWIQSGTIIVVETNINVSQLLNNYILIRQKQSRDVSFSIFIYIDK